MTLYLKLLVVISIELRRLESEKISNWQIGSCVSSIILGQWGEGMGLLELYVPFLFLGGGEGGGDCNFSFAGLDAGKKSDDQCTSKEEILINKSVEALILFNEEHRDLISNRVDCGAGSC